MLLRPARAAWFELLVGRQDLAAALSALAAGGAVELQSHDAVAPALPELKPALEEYERLAQRYASYWPPASPLSGRRRAEPSEIAGAALAHVRAWAAAADPLVARVMTLEQERADLGQMRPLLAQTHTALPNLALLCGAGPLLVSRIYLLDPKGARPLSPAEVLAEHIDCEAQSYVVAIGAKSDMSALDETMIAHKARRLELSDRQRLSSDRTLAELEARLVEIERQVAQVEAQLAALSRGQKLDEALADLALVRWLAAHVPVFEGTGHFVLVTGWTSDRSGARLDAPLQQANIQYLLDFPSVPLEIRAPVVLRNPRWARPFELFARLLGAPGENEVDPSILLALLAPLLFGFMFGDLGQGAVLVLAGLALRRRYPATKLLVSGGVAAMLFGTLFGSVFTREDILPPLWLHPLDQPLTLLGVTLAGGAGVILMGLALDALERHWAGKGSEWWASRAGLVLSYIGLIASAADLRALWLIPLGMSWFCLGAAASAEHPLACLGESLGEALETLLQLAVNTLSFVRVGAFALAHAGLSSAITTLCEGQPIPVTMLGLAVGNALIMLVEGLVVSIQTTRLVLFEFFVRFLKGYGRPFRPLRFPTMTMEPSRK